MKNKITHDKLDIDYCDEKEMYELIKYDAYSGEWNCVHIYSPYTEHLEEIIKIIEGDNK